MIVETSNGPVELSEKAFELNWEIFEIKENMRKLFRRAAGETFEKQAETIEAIVENLRAVEVLEAELAKENAE